MSSHVLLSGLAILLAIQFACTWLTGALHIAFPAPLLGMILLALLLVTKSLKVERIEGIATVLMEKMSLLFVPGAVGAIRYLEHIQKEMLPLLATIAVSTAIVIVVTGVFLQFLLKRKEAKRHA